MTSKHNTYKTQQPARDLSTSRRRWLGHEHETYKYVLRAGGSLLMNQSNRTKEKFGYQRPAAPPIMCFVRSQRCIGDHNIGFNNNYEQKTTTTNQRSDLPRRGGLHWRGRAFWPMRHVTDDQDVAGGLMASSTHWRRSGEWRCSS